MHQNALYLANSNEEEIAELLLASAITCVANSRSGAGLKAFEIGRAETVFAFVGRSSSGLLR